MSYSSVHDYFDAIELTDVDTDRDYLERLELAQEALDEVTDADIEEFDVHDAIAIVASHYGVVETDLLDYYDERQIILSYP